MKHKDEIDKIENELNKNDLYRMDRRTFVKVAGITTGALALGDLKFVQRAYGQSSLQTQLPGSAIPQFVDPLPLLNISGGTMQTVIAGTDQVELHMREFKANMLPTGTFTPGIKPETWVWGYIAGTTVPSTVDTYIGPVIVATRGTPTEIKFVNDLGNTAGSQVLAWKNSTDQTLHWADPLNGEANSCAMAPGRPNCPSSFCASHYNGSIPTVPHLHGGEVPPVLDGGPDMWFTSDGAYHGHAYYTRNPLTDPQNSVVYRYPNSQEAAPIWFHDHALGITRLNVYAGLAGAYLIVDPTNPPPSNLQGPADIIPLVIQDRMFDINGQLFFPAGLPFSTNPEHPFWVPEFIGDTIVVNGKVWPKLNVQQKRYRFLFLNGSNARTYELFLEDPATKNFGPPMWIIGTDGGYLDTPVKLDPALGQKLLMQPGERYDVIIDFADNTNNPTPSGTLIMRNTGRTPYPKGAPPDGSTIGRIIKFVVGAPATDNSYNPATLAPLRTPMIRLVNPTTGTLATGVTPQKIRQLTLNEILMPTITLCGGTYPGGSLELLVNNTKWSGKRGDGTTRTDFTPVTIGTNTTYYSELPMEGDTEIWEIVNLTADAHPIHTHLTQFQLMNRQSFDTNKYPAAYAAAFPGGMYIPEYGPPLDYNTGNTRALGGNPDITPYLKSPVMPPAPNEAGWKDTVIMHPGEVTRIAVRYAPTDKPINSSTLNYPFDPNAAGHGYVWHCHIIDHEDNEMMRPYRVTAKAGATRTYILGTDY